MEKVDVVDAHDELLGEDTRKDVHEKKFLHRGVIVLVFDPDGNLFMQQRSYDKDAFPGLWEGSMSGHVQAGEDYEEAALRELREELRIFTVPAKLREIVKFGFHDESERMFFKLYALKDYKGLIETDHDEVLQGAFWPIEKVFEELARDRDKFTPVFFHAAMLFEEIGGCSRDFILSNSLREEK